MKKLHQISALLLALLLVMGCFAGCGTTASTQESSQSSAVSAPVSADDTQPEPEASVPADVPEEASTVEEAEAPAVSIDYPIPGDNSFSVLYSKPTILDATIMSGEDFDASLSWETAVKNTGVTLEWESISEQAWDTQISLILAAQDYPDACNSNIDYTTRKTGLVEDEIMLDLAELIPQNMPNYYNLLQSDEAFANCVYESTGQLVLIQSRASTFINSGFNIRTDWLEELGMEIPSTLDQLEEFLLAAKDKYNLTNAFEMVADLNVGLSRSFNVKCEGDRMGYQLAEEGSDEIVWSGSLPAFRDYIEFLRSWYEKGIFNDDYLNISNQNGNVQSTFLSGNTAAWHFDCSGMLYDNIEGTPIPDFALVEDESTNISGVTEEAKTGTTGMMMVFTACHDPEIFLQFLDYFFTEEGNLLANWGLEGETYTIGDNGKPTYTDLVLGDTDCFMYLLRSARYGLYWAPTDFDVSLMIADYTPEQFEAVDMWVATRGSYLCTPPNFGLTSEDQEIVSTYENDCSTYFWENTYKVISCQLTMEDFDQAVQTTLDMGMNEIVEAYNHSYSEFLAS